MPNISVDSFLQLSEAIKQFIKGKSKWEIFLFLFKVMYRIFGPKICLNLKLCKCHLITEKNMNSILFLQIQLLLSNLFLVSYLSHFVISKSSLKKIKITDKTSLIFCSLLNVTLLFLDWGSSNLYKILNGSYFAVLFLD